MCRRTLGEAWQALSFHFHSLIKQVNRCIEPLKQIIHFKRYEKVSRKTVYLWCFNQSVLYASHTFHNCHGNQCNDSYGEWRYRTLRDPAIDCAPLLSFTLQPLQSAYRFPIPACTFTMSTSNFVLTFAVC